MNKNRLPVYLAALLLAWPCTVAAQSTTPTLIVQPNAFKTLVNPQCSHCQDEAKRRGDLKADDAVLCWIRGYSDGGAIPYRFFLNKYRVISDTYGVFVYDAESGYARAFAPSLDFTFHGWKSGVMVMKHKDGTLYSCLSGIAFDGPGKGDKLKPVPTLVSTWGDWLQKYPHAVAFHLFDKYQAVKLPSKEHPGSLKSRGALDKRLPADAMVLGVRSGEYAHAYPISWIAEHGFVRDDLDGKPLVLFWQPATRTAVAYRPTAVPPKDVKAEPRKLTLELDGTPPQQRFRDKETGSHWDIAGRAVDGQLKGWTLEWLDSVQVKWFAWSAEFPGTTLQNPSQKAPNQANLESAIKEIAGSAEFLMAVPKKYATLQAVDPAQRTVTLLVDGDKEPTTWKVTPDAEIKIRGWWGRLEQLQPERRLWAWFKLDRAKKPVAVFMLSDELSEQDIHGGALVKTVGKDLVLLGPKKLERTFTEGNKLPLDQGGEKCCEALVLKAKDLVFVETHRGKVVKLYDATGFEALRKTQKAWLRQQWIKEGLPASIGFVHLYSGEVDVLLDHETMRWARSLTPGCKVELAANPPIKAVVKAVAAQREKTQVRLVIRSIDLADLNMGQRVGFKMPPPAAAVENALVLPDIDQPRSRQERIDWFLANSYCTCGVDGDRCTGHFYTLASCNPNGCGAPNATRQFIGRKIDEGLTNRQIFEVLLQKRGTPMLRPHMLP